MAEFWDLLDSEGNKTGEKVVGLENIPEGFYHLGVDVWVVNSENKILIQKRSSQKRLSPNVWAMTGGSNISGETSIETIEREVKEELGIELNSKNMILATKFKTGHVWIDTYFVRQEIDLEKVVLQEEEVWNVKWASFDEIEELVQKGQFIQHRWEFVKDELKEFLKG